MNSLLFPHKKQKKNKHTNQKLVSSSIIDENNNGFHLWHTQWKSRIKNVFFFFFFISQAIHAFIFGALS